MGKEGNQCENDADHGEDLADIGGLVGEPAEAKDGGDDRDDEEDDGPVEHEMILSLKGVINYFRSARRAQQKYFDELKMNGRMPDGLFATVFSRSRVLVRAEARIDRIAVFKV